MAKYDVTHSCGHTERYDLIGPHRSREWRLERMRRDLCPDCWRSERQRKNAEAAKFNRAIDLPPLVGTAKQIPWAESIRARKVEAIDTLLNSPAPDPYSYGAHLHRAEELPAALEWLYAQTSAAWWIDQRDTVAVDLVLRALNEVKRNGAIPMPASASDAEAASAAKAEATVRPDKPRTETVAEVRIAGNTIEVVFPEKRDDFREIIRFQMRFRWAGTCWRRQIGQFNGAVADRAAEVGHCLLAARFPVRIFDAEIRERAIRGEYAPEPRRWVHKQLDGRYAGWFRITWPKNQALYEAARRIKGSKYAEGAVYVPPEQFDEVLDFAERYQFHVSPGARELAEAARRIREQALVAKVAPVRQPEPVLVEAGRVPPKLDIPEDVTVDDDLRDD